MARVTAADVRDIINIDSTQISDVRLTKMIKRGEVIVEAETGEEIDYTNCTDKQKEAITLIAALAGLDYLSGGSTATMTNVSGFSLGDLNVQSSSSSGSTTSPNAQRFQDIKDQLERLLISLKNDDISFRAVGA